MADEPEKPKVGGEKLKKEIDDQSQSQGRQLSVALVGSKRDFGKSVNIFHVLEKLNLASPCVPSDDGKSQDAAAVPAGAAKDQGKKVETVNLVEDKESGLKYLVDPLPSVIISITGDAQDMPEDDEFVEAVDYLVKNLRDSGGKLILNRVAASRAISMMTAYKDHEIKEAVDKLQLCQSVNDLVAKLTMEKPPPPPPTRLIRKKIKEAVNKPPLHQDVADVAEMLLSVTPNIEAASRAFVALKLLKEKEGKVASSTCMRISLLLELRMKELEAMNHMTFVDSKSKRHTFCDAFNHFPSVRDVMLNVLKDPKTQFESLKEYRFPENDGSKVKSVHTSSQVPKAAIKEATPVVAKRLPKARLTEFFQSGLMGAAIKVSDANRSAWIVDGGSNGGVMKMAGVARMNMGSIGLNVPLIGIGVAIENGRDQYDTAGHSHLILAVDPVGGFPITDDRKTAYGYEIEYTKLFEDSLSMTFHVPIVGLLVGGGPGSLRNVLEAIEGDFPVMVIKGTGRVADLICAIRERQSMQFVRNQCTVLGVEFERVRKCSACVQLAALADLFAHPNTRGRYSKLHVLDLNWEGNDGFVQFVESHIRNYSALSSKKQFRSSHFTDLFSLLHSDEAKTGSQLFDTATPLKKQTDKQPSDPATYHTSIKLVRDEKTTFAMWSLTFGIAQVDSHADFERVLTFGERQKGSQSIMKCAYAAVNAMRLMFPLPVAIVSTISKLQESTGQDLTEDLVTATIQKFLHSVKPFCVWSMQQGAVKGTFEIRVHIVTKKITKRKRVLQCTFNSLGGILPHEIQVAISNILRKEYGVVPIAFATMPRNTPHPISKHPSPKPLKNPNTPPPNPSIAEASDSGSEAAATSELPEPGSDFINKILSICLQSTKVLLIAQPPEAPPPLLIAHPPEGPPFPPPNQRADVFILEQALDCFNLYNELVADFFIDMKEELQQRIHGEDADGICRSACEHIKRSAAASLPLHFHKMEPETQERLIHYLPEQFLRLSFVSGEEDPKPILACEHDFDFPVFATSKCSELEGKQKWTVYWEYMFLNCGDSRPYAPCWDPIALQQKAKEMYQAVADRTMNNMMDETHLTDFNLSEYTPPHLLTDLYQHCRSVVVGDMLQHWEGIQIEKRYSDHDASVLMRRFERSIRKVFYFLLCCKPILFCQTCLNDCCLEPDEANVVTSLTNYALKCSMCEQSVQEKGDIVLKKPVYKELSGKQDVESTGCFSQLSKLLKFEGKEMNEPKKKLAKMLLKNFCFRWFMKVGFSFKKACSVFLLHRGNRFLNWSTINLSHSRTKLGILMLKNVQERSRLRQLFLQVVEICTSGMVTVQRETFDHASVDQISKTLADVMLSIVIRAEHVNKVVAECGTLRTGCSSYEAFPIIVSEDTTLTVRLTDKMTHLMVAAIEGSVHKALAYIAAADIPYIFHQYEDDMRSGHSDSLPYLSCALHMALERGNTDVANAIIDRTSNLVRGGLLFEESRMILDGLFIGASLLPRDKIYGEEAHNEVPTSFMYLARYSMIGAMDKVIAILQRLKKTEEMQQELRRYMIRPTDPNGMNALHYAVLSQSPQCVSWFVPYMHEFRVCKSSSKSAFVPPMLHTPSTKQVAILTKMMQKPTLFHFGLPKLLRAHPPSDFSDSDCRLVISEDWIQAYHYSASRIVDLDWSYNNFSHKRDQGVKPNQVASEEHSDENQNTVQPAHAKTNLLAVDIKKRKHKEMSPYELALLLWRLMDIEAMHAQQIMYNFRTNSADVEGSSQVDKGKSAAENEESSNHEDASPERLAEAYKQRCNSFSGILSKLEEAANDEMEIDAKKKKGLRQFTEYRNRRAISRMVFPVIAYLGYVVASTLMAFLMTNGLMDEPTKFTQGVINELQFGPQNGPQKDMKDIGNFNDLTLFWGALAGFLWSASPMARPFATYNVLGPVLVRQTRTPRTSCIGGQAMCTPSNYRSTTFSPDQDALFVDFPDLKEIFSFYDSSGLAYSVPFTPNIVRPQWGNEYYYSGSGYALSFACASNQNMSSACKAQQKNGYVTCNCSQRFLDLMPPPTAAADGSSSTFLDSSTRALDVSFLLFSPSLQSYMFLHLLFEFSETGTVAVWDDYVTFSGRYSKQFSSEKLTVLRVSQYVTIVYALMYLIYEWEDWKVLRARIPSSLDPSKSQQLARNWNTFKKKAADPVRLIPAALVYFRQYLGLRLRRLSCHLQLFFNKSEYYGAIYQLLELIGLACGYSVIGLDLSLQSQLRQLFMLASNGSFNDPSSIAPKDGMDMHQSVSRAHTLLAIEREVIGAYMFFTWARVFAYLVHMPGWGPYLHAIIATIFEPIVIAFVMVVVMLNAAFTIMMYCSYSITGGDDFKTLQDSFFSMWRMLMGLTDNFSFVENNRGINNPKLSKGTSGVAYIFLTVLGNLVVMNIIVGLLSERYAAIGKFSLINFNRELNANLARDIIAVKSAEGLNPFSLKIPYTSWIIGFNYLNRWKLEVKHPVVLKMMLLMEGYYLDAALSFLRLNRLNSPAVLFRLKWFHGGIAQEREVCRRLLKFANVSTTPMGVVAASNKESEEKGEGSA